MEKLVFVFRWFCYVSKSILCFSTSVVDVGLDRGREKGQVHQGDEGQDHPGEGGHGHVAAGQEVGHPVENQRKTRSVIAARIERRNEGGVKMRIERARRTIR